MEWLPEQIVRGVQSGAFIGLSMNKAAFAIPTAMRRYYDILILGGSIVEGDVLSFLVGLGAVGFTGLALQYSALIHHPGLYIVPVATNLLSLGYEIGKTILER